ncbi:hypothetical protein MKW92_027739 [Papaver armeniacum]|nr:hypothetical protein MKW92_027739 [Papaver armeniacum]
MVCEEAKAEECMKQAAKELNCWFIWGGPQYLKAADQYRKAAYYYKQSKSWVEAAVASQKAAECRLELNYVNYAALCFLDAAYNHICAEDTEKAISCFEKAVRFFEKIQKSDYTAKYCKKVGDLYETQQRIPMSIFYFERAADHFQHDDDEVSAIQCMEKVAHLRSLREIERKDV